MTRTASRLVAVAALGGLLFGYETGVAGGGLNDARDLSYFSNDSLLLLSTATLIGALIGSLAGGKLSDMIGRRDVIMATAALFTLGAFSSALAPSLDALFVARLVVGLAVGAISVAAPLYIAELAPPRSRGAFVATFQLAITLGLFSAYVLRNMFHAFPEGWRYTLGVGAVLGILLSGAALLLDESPLWLELEDGQENPALSLLGDGTSKRGDALQTLFSLAGRRGLFLCVALFFFQQFVGINAVLYFASTILSDLDFSFGLGFRPGDALPFAIVNVAMSAVAIALIDRVGRRPLLLFSFVASAAGLLVVAFGMILTSSGVQIGGMIAAAGCFVFIGGFALGIGPVPWVILSESFPIGLRGLAIGFAAASHWLFDGLASPMGLLLGGHIAIAGVFVFYMVIAIAGFFYFRARLPENRGLTLAAIDKRGREAAALIRDSRFVHYAVTTLVTTGGLLIGFNFAVTALTLVLIAKSWSLSPLEQGMIPSALVLGLAAGSFLAGSLSDRFGRRYVLMSTAALFVAGAFGSAIAPSFYWLLVGRAVTGFAIGIASPTTGIYVAEIAPTAIRGRLLSFEAVTYGIGAILAYCVGLTFDPTADGWRYMFAFIAVPSTIYGLVLLPLPESPRWLAANGRMRAARRVLARLDEPDIDGLVASLASRDQGTEAHDGWAGMLTKPHRPALMLGLVLMFLIVFCGWDMILFYAPTVLMEIGFEDTAVSFIATLGLSIVFLVMTLVSLSVIDKAGRKPMVVSGLFIMAACLGLMTIFTWMSGTSGDAMRWALVGVLAVFVGVFALTLGQVGEIVVAEIYPQAIRGPATSFSHGMRSLFALAFTLTFPAMLSMLGLHFTFLTYAIIDVIGALYLLRFLPETKDRSLEDIARYWYGRVPDKHAKIGIPSP
jgi:sugar porter (SP) family MFS transporter